MITDRFVRVRAMIAKACVALFALSLVASLGCNEAEEIGVIEGTVTYKGQPVTNATLFFRDRNRGIHIMADLKEDGTYQVFTAGGKGLPLGTYKVAVVPAGPAVVADPETGVIKTVAAKPSKSGKFPSRYEDIKTSGLTTTVESGRNQFDIQLTDEGR